MVTVYLIGVPTGGVTPGRLTLAAVARGGATTVRGRSVPRQEYDDTEREDASRFLTGLVTCFATHEGIPAVARAACRR